MDLEKIIHAWIEGSERDWLACQHLYDSKDYPQCLFWGHLVLEKILKAIVVKVTENQSPFSHDPVFPASKGHVYMDEEKRNLLNEVNTFNQFGRYDSEIVDFMKKCDPEYAEKYFNVIKNLYKWLIECYQKKK